MAGTDGWEWPAEPARTFAAWCDSAELHVALKAGWRCRIVDRLLYTDADPLSRWVTGIVKARETATPLAGRAWRNILLTAIGALHGRPHRVTRQVPLHQSHLAGSNRARVEGDWIVWDTDNPSPWPAMSHPEWSAGIWGRQRARLLSGPQQTGALHLTDGTDVVAFRTDALYVTGRQPAWEQADDGRPGRLTYRGGTTSPLPAPGTVRELLTTKQGWHLT
jgi:hypothetical protein